MNLDKKASTFSIYMDTKSRAIYKKKTNKQLMDASQTKS